MAKAIIFLACSLVATRSLVSQEPPRPFLSDSTVVPMSHFAVRDRPAPVENSCMVPRSAPPHGEVHFEFVIDTLGRVEPTTIVLMRTTDSTIVPLAREILISCRYVPGRMNGRRVRSGVGRIVHF
jgi:hypothetical protein